MAAEPEPVLHTAESADQRINRELIELLNEIRIALPGVQIVFAFLLILPFQQRFLSTSTLDQAVYFLAFMCTFSAIGLLIAPSAYHRIRFRDTDKMSLIVFGNAMLLGGTVLIAIAIVSVVFLITDLLYGSAMTIVVSAIAAIFVFGLWYGVPLRRVWRDFRAARARQTAGRE